MKSIGDVIRIERAKKRMSYAHLEKITKIKKEFLIAIEKERWNELPEFPVVAGFVKNIADALEFNRNHMVAFLRRDYPPKNNLNINPKPDVGKKFVWSPRLTFFLGVALSILIILGYLVFQYIHFISPPELVVTKPADAEMLTERKAEVSGRTESDATVKVNNQSVIVDENGNFSEEVEIFEGTKEIVVVAKSRSGKETIVSRKIEVKLEK